MLQGRLTIWLAAHGVEVEGLKLFPGWVAFPYQG